MPEDKPAKSKRTRTGCLTCRARKVKCDERPGTCRNCERVVLQCRWPEPKDIVGPDGNGHKRRSSAGASKTPTDLTPGSNREASPTRRRGLGCSACRSVRTRCSQTRPACQRCVEQGFECSYQAPSQSGQSPDQKPSAADLASPSTRNVVLNRAMISAHMDAYFSHVHPVSANGFLHPDTTRHLLATGRIDRKLLLAICAVSSQFLQLEPSFAAALQPDAWAGEAKTRLIIDADMSIDSLATALILARHDISTGRYGSAWLLTSMANRIALCLGLHKEPPEDMPFVLAESRRRLYWACFCFDRMMSTGVSEFVTTSAERVHLRLPADEHQFSLGLPVQTPFGEFKRYEPYYPANQSLGLLAHYIYICGMRYEARNLVRNELRDETLPPWDPNSRFDRMTRQFIAWRHSLSAQFELIPDTMYARQSQDSLTQLAMIHIWYDQCMSDLYRIVLPGFPESMVEPAPEPWATQTRLACVAHAKGVTNTLRLLQAHAGPNFVCLDSALPFTVLESARIRVTDVFMAPLQDQPVILAEMTDDFTLMMGFVERMKPYFKQAVWLHKEMRLMLRRHGIIVRQGTEESSVDGSADEGTTANHPWQDRMRKLRESDKAISAMTMQSVDFLFASSLATSQIPELPFSVANIEGLVSPLGGDIPPPAFAGGPMSFSDWMAPGYIPQADGVV